MKHLKILGLVAVAAMAMMAFAASASATTVTGPGGETTPAIHAVHEGTHVTLDNPIATIECVSTVAGKVEAHGGTYAEGEITFLSFIGCTKQWHVTVITSGGFRIEALGGNKGKLFSSGATVETTRFGIICFYATEGNPGTHIGTVTGGNPATLHIEGSIRFHGGSPLCGEKPVPWTGDYVTTGTIDIH